MFGIHAVWGTKQQAGLITPSIEKLIYDRMCKEPAEIGCPVQAVKGMPDYIHLFFRLSPKLLLMEVMKQVKCCTTRWINERGITPDVFDWQMGYGAFSVSESKVDTVYRYICGQKDHHRNQTFEEEFQWLVQNRGMTYQP